jgi:ATP-dependent Clp protease protease subunit
MIHQPTGGFSGQAEDIDIQAKEILRTTETLNSILASLTGQDVEKVATDTQRDYYFSSEEAKSYGIIDSVMHERKLKAVPSN